MWMRESVEITALSLASTRLVLYQVSRRHVFRLLYRRVGRSRFTNAFPPVVPKSRDALFLTFPFTHLTFLLFVALFTRLFTLFFITSTFTLGSTHHHLQLHMHLLFLLPEIFNLKTSSSYPSHCYCHFFFISRW